MNATIKPDFFVQELAGEKILMGGGEQINFSKVLMLNRTSAFMIEELQRAGTTSAAGMAQKLTERFEVDYAAALADVEAFFSDLAQKGVAVVAEEDAG